MDAKLYGWKIVSTGLMGQTFVAKSIKDLEEITVEHHDTLDDKIAVEITVQEEDGEPVFYEKIAPAVAS